MRCAIMRLGAVYLFLTVLCFAAPAVSGENPASVMALTETVADWQPPDIVEADSQDGRDNHGQAAPAQALYLDDLAEDEEE